MTADAHPGARPWRALVIDDEPLARLRMRQLLVDVGAREGCVGVLEAASGRDALRLLDEAASPGAARDGLAALALVFADVRMPDIDGLQLAGLLRRRYPEPGGAARSGEVAEVAEMTEEAELAEVAAGGVAPQLIFVTAHAEHALQAFDVQACDYLTKPVGRERLGQAIRKALRDWRGWTSSAPPPPPPLAAMPHLSVDVRGQTQRIPLSEVACVRAELKYLTVRTAGRDYLMEGTLQSLETEHPGQWVRVHRSAVANAAFLDALVRGPAPPACDGLRVTCESQEVWFLRLRGIDELLPVSRRQLKVVREALDRRVALRQPAGRMRPVTPGPAGAGG